MVRLLCWAEAWHFHWLTWNGRETDTPGKAVKIITMRFCFSGMGTKEVQKLKGGEQPSLVEMFGKHCNSKQYLLELGIMAWQGQWDFSTATICWWACILNIEHGAQGTRTDLHIGIAAQNWNTVAFNWMFLLQDFQTKALKKLWVIVAMLLALLALIWGTKKVFPCRQVNHSGEKEMLLLSTFAASFWCSKALQGCTYLSRQLVPDTLLILLIKSRTAARIIAWNFLGTEVPVRSATLCI